MKVETQSGTYRSSLGSLLLRRCVCIELKSCRSSFPRLLVYCLLGIVSGHAAIGISCCFRSALRLELSSSRVQVRQHCAARRVLSYFLAIWTAHIREDLCWIEANKCSKAPVGEGQRSAGKRKLESFRRSSQIPARTIHWTLTLKVRRDVRFM